MAVVSPDPWMYGEAGAVAEAGEAATAFRDELSQQQKWAGWEIGEGWNYSLLLNWHAGSSHDADGGRVSSTWFFSTQHYSVSSLYSLRPLKSF